MKKQIFFLLFINLLGTVVYSQQNIGNYLCKERNISDDSLRKNFIDLNNGEKIYAKRVDIWGNGLKLRIKADDSLSYKLSEVKTFQIYIAQKMGFSNKYNILSEHYTVINGDLYRTIVSGKKISVFEKRTHYGEMGVNGEIRSSYWYIKNGGSLTSLKTIEDLVTAIGDCKSTYYIKNIDHQDLKQEVKENKRALNEYFEKYNDKCN